MGKDKKDKKDKKEKRGHDDRKRRRERDEAEERHRASKLAKKLAKQIKKGGNTVAGYTDEDNPFGDTTLTEKFVWNKKLEKQIHDGTDVRELGAEAEHLRQEGRLAEISKVKKRREEREEEKARMEEELAVIERQRALADAHVLEKKEEEFHLKQALVRSKKRLEEGRAKPVDRLAKNLQLDEDFDPRMPYPYRIFDNLSLSELTEVQEEIGSHQELDTQEEEHKEFWDCLMTVCESQLAEAAGRDEMDRAHLRGEEFSATVVQEAGLHASVDKDLEELMANKNYRELQELDKGIEEELESGDCADPEYWEAVRKRLKVQLAKAKLRDIHYRLHERHRVVAEASIPKQMGWEEGDAPGEGAAQALPEDQLVAEIKAPEEPEPVTYARLLYQPMTMSPPRLSQGDLMGDEVVDAEEDLLLLVQLRAQVEYHASGKFRAARELLPGSSSSDADAAYQKMLNPNRGPMGVPVMMRNLAATDDQTTFRSGKAPVEEEDNSARRMMASVSKMMGEDAGEVQFSVEASLASQVYWWHDKYRPRKPKYFNRVHTGYEWNKYNQTHYDHDNPPPKVVQGYKFNIFYPDLIDKQKAPIYKLEKDPSSPDGQTCVLRFTAGPPYEDIAFKIVNKEWEYAHKKGFKCSFERGIMHLYFNFKRASRGVYEELVSPLLPVQGTNLRANMAGEACTSSTAVAERIGQLDPITVNCGR